MAPRERSGREEIAAPLGQLVEALREAPEIVHFREAEEQFRTDAELARMRSGLRWSFESMQRSEREGHHDPRLFQEIREAQERLQRHPLVVQFAAARAEAFELLSEANGAMTEILGVDVAITGRPAGGCCG